MSQFLALAYRYISLALNHPATKRLAIKAARAASVALLSYAGERLRKSASYHTKKHYSG